MTTLDTPVSFRQRTSAALTLRLFSARRWAGHAGAVTGRLLPGFVSTLLQIVGLALLVAGVFTLAGRGWAMVSACPCLLLAGEAIDPTPRHGNRDERSTT